MNKIDARQLAEKYLDKYMREKREVILHLLEESELFIEKLNGVEYQIRVRALKEDESDENSTMIMVAVDDYGFWSTFCPLCDSDYPFRDS